ncbi:MAG: response regulator [Pseudomonadota bacterium]
MKSSPGFIRKHLDLKTLITIGVTFIMGGIIFFSIVNQREHSRERMMSYGQDMKSLAYAGIKHPMAVGDSPSIEKQLFDIEGELENTEVVICDFNQRIVFATHVNYIGKDVSFVTDNKETLVALTSLLEESIQPKTGYFEEKGDGQNFLTTLHIITNETECHHCHGDTRQVLGALLVRQSTNATYATIATLQNRTLIICIIGIATLIAFISFLLARLVTKPVTELAAKAKQLALGDLSVSVPVTSDDSIGVLSNSFNYMVLSIKDQIEYANSLKEAIADPLITVDTDMVVTFINEACASITGFSKQETVGKLTCRDIFRSEICRNDICDSTCPLKKCLVSGERVTGIRTTIINKRGLTIPIITSASAQKDAHGNITGAVEIFRDISLVLEAERLVYIKKIAEKEEEERKHLESLAENLLSILSQVSSGNLKVRAICSNDHDVMDKIAQHINSTLDNLEKLYHKIATFSKEMELEVARRTMMLRSKTLLLERANKELQELDRLKSSFLANMSHELRTPMNSILGYTDLLLDRVDGEINEEQEKSLQKVENNAKHLLELINDILDMSKIESGKMELDINKTDLKDFMEYLAVFFQPALQAKNLYLKFNFVDNPPPVYIDKDKVRQIFNNLLSNALKFTSHGGITVHVKPSTLTGATGQLPLFVEICVEDTGIGIQPEDMEKLFDKFTQINVSASRQYEGTGLGLSIARGLVVLHRGVIWAESEFGKGSRFYFTLPAQEKILEKNEEPIIEQEMAEALAQYFDKPVDVFLKNPIYGGQRVKCWEFQHCGQSSCPAYGNKELRCWLIAGIHCKGVKVVKFPEKATFCKGCDIIENLVIEECKLQDTRTLLEDTEQPAAVHEKTVMAIDDNPEVIELIRKNIGSDYTVVGLLSGQGAVETARKIKPIAITLDIMMPERNGWMVLQDLKRHPETQDIPVIILSIVDEKQTGFSLGAAEYLVKPINKKILLHKLKNIEKLTSIKNILIVDNEHDTCELLKTVLMAEEYQVRTAVTSNDAMKAIEASPPDLIVLNLIMPDAHGFDLIEFVKSRKEIKSTPLILITNKDLSEEDMIELNGQIQATLNKGILSEQNLLEELKKTIKKI